MERTVKSKNVIMERRASDSIQKKILFDRRIIMLTDPIDSESSRDLCENLMALDCLKKAPILLKINCPGGAMEHGIAILDTMDSLRSPIHTVVCGEASSMATFIAMNGRKRLMTRNSHMMFHEMHRESSDYYSKEKYRFKYEERLWLGLRQLYITKTKFTKEDIAIIDAGELWLDAQECLKKGIIDAISG
jgi:ATP-dependent Clp protease protease subunit